MLKPIRTDEEYKAALQQISLIMDKDDLNQDETDRLELLALLCECHENNKYPISYARKIRLKALAIASGVSKQNAEKNEKITAEPPVTEAKRELGALRCAALQPGVTPLKQKPNVPAEVYKPGDLEHPAIPGLKLNLEQRLYSAALEIMNSATGEVRHESIYEKRFRVIWQKPIPMTKSRTDHTFVKMDLSLFK